MTQSKGSFTPGPWKWQIDEVDGETHERIKGPDGDTVLAAEEHHGYAWCGVSEANARLIAAAPALLEIAREALRVAEGDVEDRRGVIEANDDYEPDDAVLAALIIRRDRIAAAIQSATGEG